MNQTTTAPAGWGEQVARHLLDSSACPVCGQSPLTGGCCGRCGADLRGAIGVELWEASTAAADAVRRREALLGKVPRLGSGASSPESGALSPDGGSLSLSKRPDGAEPAGTGALRQAQGPSAENGSLSLSKRPDGAEVLAAPRSSATLQSVLATTGAALFAIAAIVFTYFNPDLADRGLRAVVTGIVTLLFLGGAWLLARRGLRFSAEAVGGLGLVFTGLDVHAATQLLSPGAEPWLTAALATAVCAGIMLAAALRSGIRIWLWTALLALASVPAMLGHASGSAFGASLGHAGAAFAGAALVEALPRLGRRLTGPDAGEAAPGAEGASEAEGASLRPERIALTGLQLLASLSALAVAAHTAAPTPAAFTLALAAVLALVTVHAIVASRHLLRRLWSAGAGVAGVSALTAAVYATAWPVVDEQGWAQAVIPTTAAFAVVLLAGLLPLPERTSRRALAAGALGALAAACVVPLSYAGMVGAVTVVDFIRFAPGLLTGYMDVTGPWAVVLGLAGSALGLGCFSALSRRRSSLRGFTAPTRVIALSAGTISVLVLGCHRLLPTAASVFLLTGVAMLVGVLLLLPDAVRAKSSRVTLLVGAHLLIVTSMMVSWQEPASAPVIGLATLAALAVTSWAGARALRFVHVGLGFGYALILIATALGTSGVGGVVQLALTASAGLAGAIVATFLPRIGARAWQAVLVVAVVPFVLGVLQVVFERSGWTALSTGLMFILGMALLLTRRPGLTVVVRTLAAGMLVPSLAVVIVCLGAQLLDASASPVTLPVIAALVALTLPATTLIRDALAVHGLEARAANAARIAIEASALLTGVIAIGLALVRDAAGLGTSFLVLLILGIGAAAGALFARRRYAWWAAAASFTGALWCVWGMAGVDLLEAYLLPPALGASLVAAVLTVRGRRATGLYAAGLGIAIAPLLAVLALAEPESPAGEALPWRAAGLLAAACALLGLATVRSGASGRLVRLRRLGALRTATFGAAGLAATAGTIQGIRLGLGADIPWLHGATLFTACVGVSAVGALVLACAGRGIRSAAPEGSRRRRTRWLEAPAVLAFTAGVWTAIERDWFSIWAMWALMIGILVLMLLVAQRGPGSTLPPVWFLFGAAFVTAVVAWSPRDLRVEWFSLPLGAFLLLAGVIGMRGVPPTGERPTLNSWPGRWIGSWSLLAPGIVVMMIASIVSTFTDPLTWRAILVMVLALAAILAGSARRLAAPFLLGLIVLPIENVFVFSVQIGRGVESMPWWITLAVIGAVLLIIAVTAERRTGAESSVAARIRDLR